MVRSVTQGATPKQPKPEDWTSFETSRGFQRSPKAGFRSLRSIGMCVSFVNLVTLQQAVFRTSLQEMRSTTIEHMLSSTLSQITRVCLTATGTLHDWYSCLCKNKKFRIVRSRRYAFEILAIWINEWQTATLDSQLQQNSSRRPIQQ